MFANNNNNEMKSRRTAKEGAELFNPRPRTIMVAVLFLDRKPMLMVFLEVILPCPLG